MASYLKKYYNILGLPVNASQSAIKKAYFKLAKQYHPDVNPSSEAKKKFIEINKAYEILSNTDQVRQALYRAYYAKQKKKKQKATKKKAEDIRYRTSRRAHMPKREFIRKTPKEILIRDLKRVRDFFLVICGTLSLPLFFIAAAAGAETFLVSLLIFLIIAGIVSLFPIIAIVSHYYRTRNGDNT